MKTELSISGMTCGHCQAAVTKALKDVPGVQNAEVNLQDGSATVEGDASAQALIAAVVEEGYGAQIRQ
ncbi:CopZ family metallochaperone [Deinococcus maricopensis]|uniref:Heavy metal transport/detoxification protein n=1 Tax=Deinococcus maricopensis (strain DSM 21211 / LMG 22137 / NRRL B-23946 / LB-34) TaxID=709986 RepID=E8U489_DEIML|nr:heavy-metal-associated domain-containing protein [Deinococcus maricopensis]ADV65926.1 Heavy metal transport/detoxification protein [Deinococcus maricopensis DSM 21211]